MAITRYIWHNHAQCIFPMRCFFCEKSWIKDENRVLEKQHGNACKTKNLAVETKMHQNKIRKKKSLYPRWRPCKGNQIYDIKILYTYDIWILFKSAHDIFENARDKFGRSRYCLWHNPGLFLTIFPRQFFNNPRQFWEKCPYDFR